MKDSEVPPPLALEAKVIDLGTTDDDGEPETSLVLVAGGATVRVVPTGVNQRKVYDALIKQAKKEIHSYTKADLNRLARSVIAPIQPPKDGE